MTTLLIWTIVAATNAYMRSPQEFYDWRPLVQVASPQACERAAKNLGLKEGKYRCIGSEGNVK